MISPTGETTGSSSPSTPTSTSRPEIARSTRALGSWRKASASAAVEVRRASGTGLMPTLEPRRAGLQKAG